jgi:hypothetical protein
MYTYFPLSDKGSGHAPQDRNLARKKGGLNIRGDGNILMLPPWLLPCSRLVNAIPRFDEKATRTPVNIELNVPKRKGDVLNRCFSSRSALSLALY